jgi:transposase-like protein
MEWQEYLRAIKARKAAVVALLGDPSLSYKEVAFRMGLDVSTVYRIRREAGLPRRVGTTGPKAAMIEKTTSNPHASTKAQAQAEDGKGR